MKNALEGLMIGGIFEGLGRGVQAVSPAIKDNFAKFKSDFVDMAKFD